MINAVPPDVLPMLADRGIPKSLDGWAAEPKLDGWRARVLAGDGRVRLRTRSGRDISSSVRSDKGHMCGSPPRRTAPRITMS